MLLNEGRLTPWHWGSIERCLMGRWWCLSLAACWVLLGSCQNVSQKACATAFYLQKHHHGGDPVCFEYRQHHRVISLWGHLLGGSGCRLWATFARGAANASDVSSPFSRADQSCIAEVAVPSCSAWAIEMLSKATALNDITLHPYVVLLPYQWISNVFKKPNPYLTVCSCWQGCVPLIIDILLVGTHTHGQGGQRCMQLLNLAP